MVLSFVGCLEFPAYAACVLDSMGTCGNLSTKANTPNVPISKGPEGAIRSKDETKCPWPVLVLGPLWNQGSIESREDGAIGRGHNDPIGLVCHL